MAPGAPGCGVRLGPHRHNVVALGRRDSRLGAGERALDEQPEDLRLGADGREDRVDGDAGRIGDRGHCRGLIALLNEQPVGSVDDRAARVGA